MHEQDACGSFGAKLQCWKGRIGKIHIGVSRGFLPATKESKESLRGFISHHVGEPTQCWWATDTDVLGEAMACNTHFAHGRTTPRYSTDWQAAHDELFHRCRGLLLDCSGMEGASSSFIIGSSELWKHKF